MKTYRGTEYATLRRLACTPRLGAPSLADCRRAETEGRLMHRNGWREHAGQALLIARAMWSAYRLAHPGRPFHPLATSAE